jgi:hypothetical protein
MLRAPDGAALLPNGSSADCGDAATRQSGFVGQLQDRVTSLIREPEAKLS